MKGREAAKDNVKTPSFLMRATDLEREREREREREYVLHLNTLGSWCVTECDKYFEKITHELSNATKQNRINPFSSSFR